MLERYVATLVGCGYGDTLGMAVEGWRKPQIEKYVGKVVEPIAPVFVKDSSGNLVTQDEFGKLAYYTIDLSQGDVTDDTILAIAIAESIVRCRGLNLKDICERQVKTYINRLQPNGYVVGGFGRTTKDAFENLRKGISPLDSGVSPGLGTGPCMKMAPVGLYMHVTGNYEEGIIQARLIGRATHIDERAIASGVVQAHAVYELLNRDLTRQEFLKSVLNCCNINEKDNPPGFPRAEKGNLRSKLKWILENQNVEDSTAKDVLKCSSLAISAYPFTIFMFQKYWNKPIEGLIETVNWGGDCDTTGAMYGSLCGAKNGMIFPESWKLNEKERLAKFGEAIWRIKK